MKRAIMNIDFFNDSMKYVSGLWLNFLWTKSNDHLIRVQNLG
ncbi:hypothetical protein [Belliella alkalica]|nr:hypothetical protein [Belliella alkalica]